MAQQYASLSTPPETFSGQHEPNPKGHLNVVTLRNGKKLEDSNKKSNNENKESEQTQHECEVVEEEKEKSYVTPPPYKQQISFP